MSSRTNLPSTSDNSTGTMSWVGSGDVTARGRGLYSKVNRRGTSYADILIENIVKDEPAADATDGTEGSHENDQAVNGNDHYSEMFEKRCHQISILQAKLVQDMERPTLSFDEQLDQDWIVRRQVVRFLEQEPFVTERDLEYRFDAEITLTQQDMLFQYLRDMNLRRVSAQLVAQIGSLAAHQWITLLPDLYCGELERCISLRTVKSIPSSSSGPGIGLDLDAVLEDRDSDLWFARGYNNYNFPIAGRSDNEQGGGATLRRGMQTIRVRAVLCPTDVGVNANRNVVYNPASRIRQRVIRTYNRIRNDPEDPVHKFAKRIRDMFRRKAPKYAPAGN